MTITPASQTTAEMNVTPLIDILLVLLIIFMVITPLTPRGLDALIPQPATNHESVQQSTVVVQLRQSGDSGAAITINSEPVPWDSFNARLHSIFDSRSEKVLFVKGERDITFDKVAQVIDIAHAAGVDRVGLLTDRNLRAE